MTLLKRPRRHYALIGVAVLLLIPVAVAVLAPLLAPIPSQASGWKAPPLPERDETLPDFQHLLEPLPLVVRDLPDAASQEVIAIYDTTSVTDHQSALRMVAAAEEAIVLPTSFESPWRSWLNDPQSNDVPGSVMEYLQEDPLNADRLSNLAAAMYFEVLTRGTHAFDTEGSTRARQALSLLDSTIVRFPGSRAPILNLAYIDSLGGELSFSGTRSGDFDAWLAAHPEDVTALRLAVSFYVNSNWYYVQYKDALQTRAAAMSQAEDPARAAFGYTMLGDIELGDLRLADLGMYSGVELAPYATMHSAQRALEHYDHALVLSDDVSIYAARAFALSLLGDIPSAITAQQRAVELLPESAPLRLLLTDLYLQQRGTTEQIRAAIETARSIEREVIIAALTQETPRLSDFRPITDFGEVTGLASNLPEKFYGYYMNMLAGGRGGGFVVSFDLIPLYGRQPTTTDSLNPVERAIDGAVLKSEALGDAEGVDEILSLQQSLMQEANWSGVIGGNSWDESSATVARLVADPDNASKQDLYSDEVWDAAYWLRFAGANDEAIDLCRSALSLGEADSARAHQCVAENHYLLGDYEASQEAFEAIDDDLMVGYVAERRGDVDEAIRRYEYVVESDDESTRGTAMLRLADVLLGAGDPDRAIALYDEFLASATSPPGCADKISCPLALVAPLALSNRGIARLQALADDNRTMDCEGEEWEACTAAFLDFDAALESDPYNPVFLMNQAWAARLLGDPTLSAQLMDRALEADTSLYPVLNDVGVFAAISGDKQQAKQHFLDAAAANPRYDLAWWNLGVLNMQEGIGGILRGQAYLARAILQNPSLATESLSFQTDERVYRVEVNERLRPGAGWSFGTASSIATAAFGLVTMAVVIFHAAYLVAREKLLDELHSKVETRSRQIEARLRGRLPSMANAAWVQWIPVASALAVLMFTTSWIAGHGEPNAATASAALALFAVVLAVVVHELGHALVAWKMNATIRPTQWTFGTVLALPLSLVNVSAGPFTGQKVVAESETAAKWVYMAGPLANLAVAIIAYLLFTMQPLPGIRLISQVQLAAMGYALLPFAPLDGAALAHAHPRLLRLLGGTALLLGVLFTVGIL